jgi:hypothetical protein
MKIVVFWDIKTQFIPQRKHITYPLHSPASSLYVRFEVFTAVTLKNAVFWDVTPCAFILNAAACIGLLPTV